MLKCIKPVRQSVCLMRRPAPPSVTDEEWRLFCSHVDKHQISALAGIDTLEWDALVDQLRHEFDKFFRIEWCNIEVGRNITLSACAWMDLFWKTIADKAPKSYANFCKRHFRRPVPYRSRDTDPDACQHMARRANAEYGIRLCPELWAL